MRNRPDRKSARALRCLLLAILAFSALSACAARPGGAARAGDARLGAALVPEPLSFLEGEFRRDGGFVALADRRVFAVMAFLNAAGFDEEAGGPMGEARLLCRELVAANLKGRERKLEDWRRFYRGSRLGSFVYQDYVLSLSADYPFRRIRPDSELGYPKAAKALERLPGMLNEFWTIARLDEVWKELSPHYQAAISAYDLGSMGAEVEGLWSYLREERPDTFVFVMVPNLLDRRYSAIGARYEGYYYGVESPGAGSGGLNLHEYLHSYVNPLVAKALDPGQASGGLRDKLALYYEKGRTGPYARSYQEPVTFVAECLVRALDNRLRGAATTTAQETAGGLGLVGPFHLALEGFEASKKSFSDYLPELLAAVE